MICYTQIKIRLPFHFGLIKNKLYFLIKMDSNLLSFIKNQDSFDDAIDKLKKKPFLLRINVHKNLYNFNYAQGRSLKTHPIVQESRGKVIDKDEMKIVCWPPNRFFNHNEEECADIDWDTASVQFKEDGSLIKIFYAKDQWFIGTRGCVNTVDDNILNNLKKININWDLFNPNYCYFFELIGPENKIKVEYEKTELVHLGTRCMKTYKELDIKIPTFRKPKRFQITTLHDCIEVVKTFEGEKAEGFVVVDANYKRIKIKSPDYINKSKTKIKNPYDIFIEQEKDEWYPFQSQEMKNQYDDIEFKFNQLCKTIENILQKILDMDVRYISNYLKNKNLQKYKQIIFSLKNKKFDDINECVFHHIKKNKRILFN